MSINQSGVINTQRVKDRGVNIVNVEPIFDGMEPEVVGFTDDDAWPDASAGHPHRETVRIMVAAVAFL
jgi:hypothetical protein